MNMFVIVILLVVLVAIAVFLKAKQPAGGAGLTFEARIPLFSPTERSFFGVLEQALGSNYRVLGKVRLGDIVKPAKGLSNSQRTTAHNKLHQKHVDYVICNIDDLSVAGVVELDDQSHSPEDRAKRDEFVDQALAGANIPMLHISAQKSYALQDIRTKLSEAFKLSIVSVAQSATAQPDQSANRIAAPPLTTQDELLQPTALNVAQSWLSDKPRMGSMRASSFGPVQPTQVADRCWKLKRIMCANPQFTEKIIVTL